MNLTWTALMTFCIRVDLDHTYKQAVAIAYEKAKLEGAVDEIIAAECEIVINSPEPDVVYHESADFASYGVAPCGGTYYPSSSMWATYEREKITGVKYYAASLADEIQAELEKKSMNSDMLITRKGRLTTGSDTKVDQFYNQLAVGSSLLDRAVEYAEMMRLLEGYGVDFADAPYARYFLRSAE